MREPTPARRSRGGQPGNQNSKGNRGNSFARGKLGNRGGFGAPRGNERARKRRTLLTEVRADYARVPEALAWIDEHPELGQMEVFQDSYLIGAVYAGLTPDELAKSHREFELGLYVAP
ncbi:MAG: hypothetical protein WAM70_03830 [Pyrinomonadaceae bacterium]